MQESDFDSSLVVWVPAPREIVGLMLSLAGVTAGDVVYDLGCGDGRVLTLAVNGFGATRAIGYELRRDLCETAREMIRSEGLQDSVEVINADIREADLSGASVVALYLTTEANKLMCQRLERELKPGSRVVTYLFPIPGWLPEEEVDLASLSFEEGNFVGKLYLYLTRQSHINPR